MYRWKQIKKIFHRVFSFVLSNRGERESVRFSLNLHVFFLIRDVIEPVQIIKEWDKYLWFPLTHFLLLHRVDLIFNRLRTRINDRKTNIDIQVKWNNNDKLFFTSEMIKTQRISQK